MSLLAVETDLDVLLNIICEKLQITQTQHGLAEDHYKAVNEWLFGDGPFSDLQPSIYPQGSFRLGTTVKPIGRGEYDLDFVCEMSGDPNKYQPIQILRAFQTRLSQNEIYRGKVELKKRCVRLTYEHDFHMDILPAFSLGVGDGIKIPDREAKEWLDSNPKGYANWFEGKTRYARLLEKAMDAEELPPLEEASSKPVLKRVVQLMKRHRDVAFSNNSGAGPISIILTTLAGLQYEGSKSIGDALSSVLQKIILGLPANGVPPHVFNPSKPTEDLSERWKSDSGLYHGFVAWIKDFQVKWETIRRQTGTDLANGLEELFDEKSSGIVRKAFTDFAQLMQKNRTDGNLRVEKTTGLLTTNIAPKTIPYKKNTFYGD